MSLNYDNPLIRLIEQIGCFLQDCSLYHHFIKTLPQASRNMNVCRTCLLEIYQRLFLIVDRKNAKRNNVENSTIIYVSKRVADVISLFFSFFF